jgi:hypothetical protein
LAPWRGEERFWRFGLLNLFKILIIFIFVKGKVRKSKGEITDLSFNPAVLFFLDPGSQI